MRIRVWNAYASNNSGSYTIVGKFESGESAAKVAAELLALAKAQSAWVAAKGAQPSPLASFASSNNLSSYCCRADWLMAMRAGSTMAIPQDERRVSAARWPSAELGR